MTRWIGLQPTLAPNTLMFVSGVRAGRGRMSAGGLNRHDGCDGKRLLLRGEAELPLAGERVCK